MAKTFVIMHDEQIVLRQKGVYKQAQLYTYGDQVFAKVGGGFIGLRKPDHANGTTNPNVTWEKDSLSFEPVYEKGRMVVGGSYATIRG